MLMKYDDYQEEFSVPVLRVGDYRGQIVNLSTGTPISFVSNTRTIYGPDQVYGSAISFGLPQNFGNVSLSLGTIMIWYQGAFSLSINGVVIPITEYGQYGYPNGMWYLGYASDVSEVGNLVVTPSGNINIFDLMAFNSSISLTAIEYYFNNATVDNGNIVFPRF